MLKDRLSKASGWQFHKWLFRTFEKRAPDPHSCHHLQNNITRRKQTIHVQKAKRNLAEQLRLSRNVLSQTLRRGFAKRIQTKLPTCATTVTNVSRIIVLSIMTLRRKSSFWVLFWVFVWAATSLTPRSKLPCKKPSLARWMNFSLLPRHCFPPCSNRRNPNLC